VSKDEDLAATLALRRSLVSDDRQRHNRVLVEKLSDGFGSRARVQSALERYERRGQISARQARAGERIYAAYALGVVGARNGEATGNGSDPGGYSDAQLAMAEEYRLIRDAVGGRLWPIVFSVAIEDFSVARWCNERGRGMHPAGGMELLRHALNLAADVLGDV
jgi:hypothetical protein